MCIQFDVAHVCQNRICLKGVKLSLVDLNINDMFYHLKTTHLSYFLFLCVVNLVIFFLSARGCSW